MAALASLLPRFTGLLLLGERQPIAHSPRSL